MVGPKQGLDAVLLARASECEPVLPGHILLPLDHQTQAHPQTIANKLRGVWLAVPVAEASRRKFRVQWRQARRSIDQRIYQWAIVNDYLPRLVGFEVVGEIESEGPRHYSPGRSPRIPLEFADAAFRYGHSQVREQFELNSGSGRLHLFPDLLGFRPVAAERAIEWDRLFDVPGRAPAQRAKRSTASW